jgi:cell division protein FtsZ
MKCISHRNKHAKTDINVWRPNEHGVRTFMIFDDLVKKDLPGDENGGGKIIVSDFSSGYEYNTDISRTGADFLVIGIGTAGTKIIEQLHQLAGPGLRTLVIHSNRESLEYSSASSRFYLKHTYFSKGFGLCGADADLVDCYAQATRMASPDIEPLLENPEFCFIVTGMGGNMGTGAAPVIARLMRERGVVVTVIVTRPFSFERTRIERAEKGLRKLGEASHTVIILEFEKLRAVLPRATVLPKHFSVMNYIIALAIRNIWESTDCESFVNFDREDLHYMLEHGITGTLLLGEFPLSEKQSWHSLSKILVPLMDFPVHEVKRSIIHITAGNDICLFETDQIAMMVSEPFDPHAEVIFGASIREEMEGKVRLFSIVTGLREYGREPAKPVNFPFGSEPKQE